MTNKVRPEALGLRVDERAAAGPALYRTSPGGASIRDDSQTLRSKRYIATMVLEWDGWVLHMNTPPGAHGPFESPESAFTWWLEHRRALPPPRKTPGSGGSWPPGIDQDWAENDDF